MDELKRHKLVFKIFRPIAKLAMWVTFNYTCDDLKDVEGPFLVLANHNLNIDPIFVGIAAHRHVYFMASETVTRGGFGSKLLAYLFKPILHKKGKAGIGSSKEVIRNIKAGNSVCIFAEGNRSFNGLTCPINEATGKLARRTGGSLVTYKIEGGYFSHPRWAYSIRRGKLTGKLVNVYTPDQLRSMSDDEVNAAIKNDLFEDAYATQAKQRIKYRGKKLAAGLEAALFECPACKKFQTLTSDAKSIKCTCGFSSTFDVYGDMKGSDGLIRTVTSWDAEQRADLEEFYKKAAKTGEAIFTDKVSSTAINEDHSAGAVTDGTVTAYADRIVFGDRTYTLDEIKGMALFVRNTIIIYIGDEMKQYNVRGSESFCALKYYYLYKLAKENN